MDSKTAGDINRCLCMIVNLFTDVYHSVQFRNYRGTKVSDDFNKTIQMNKSSKFYSMMTVQRFEQQTDEIIVIAPLYTVITIRNSNGFFLRNYFSSFQFYTKLLLSYVQ